MIDVYINNNNVIITSPPLRGAGVNWAGPRCQPRFSNSWAAADPVPWVLMLADAVGPSQLEVCGFLSDSSHRLRGHKPSVWSQPDLLQCPGSPSAAGCVLSPGPSS